MNDLLNPRRDATNSIEEAASQLRLLIHTGILLSRERSLDVIVQAALDAGLKLCGAAFGAFFYNNVGPDGSPYQLYKLSGEGIEAFAQFPAPRSTQIFAESFVHGRILCIGDVLKDTRYGHNRPFFGMPKNHPPVRSYLSVPVLSRSGETLGALIYGHPGLDMFSGNCETLVATIAAQAAVAIDNARLAENLIHEIAHTDAARQAQRETAERLEQVFDAMTDGVALMDRSWCFTYLNRAGAKVFGEERAIVGRLYLEAFPEGDGSIFQRKYAEAMEGHSVEFTDYDAPLDRWIALRVFPTPEGIAIFFQDVTRQRQAERELLEGERRLRHALDAGQMGTWSWNAATDELDFDERGAALFHVQPHAPVKRRELRQRLVHREDLPQTPEDMNEILEDSGIYRAEYRITTPEGGLRWVAARGLASFKDGSNEIAGMIGTVQDITARKTQEAVLRQSEKLAATGRLAATIAHEINNPLEAVTNLIYLCRTDPTTPAPVRRALETADGELARVSQIAQQTLGFYRDTTRPTEIDLSALLREIADLFSRKLGYKALTCKLEVADDLRVFGLQGELRQIFSNLLVNAIDACSKGEIRIRARRRRVNGRDGVSVVVADPGTGIPQAIRDRLFTPFFTTKEATGTGLGLWVTQGMVEKHGGTVTYYTRTQPPTGTVFRVFVPAKIADPGPLGSSHPDLLQ